MSQNQDSQSQPVLGFESSPRDHPSRIDTHLLHLKLEPTFTSKPPASADPAKLFRLSSTLVSTYEDAIDFLSSQQVGVFQAQVAALRAQSAAMQAKGGISIGIELLACGTIVHLMPDGHPGL